MVCTKEGLSKMQKCSFCDETPQVVQGTFYPGKSHGATRYTVMCVTDGCPKYKAEKWYAYSPEDAIAIWNTKTKESKLYEKHKENRHD